MIRGARILVVEDEPLSRDVLVRMLKTRSAQVEEAADGAACLERLERADDLPSLVLLDVSMPGMSGLDVLRWIRRRWSGDKLPVILVSALINSEDVVAGLEAGANDYVVKPVNLPILIARIGVCLRMKQSVERLVEAENHRVMLSALGDTCDQLAEPMREVTDHLDQLISDTPTDVEKLRAELAQIREWTGRMSDLLERLRKVADFRRIPYTEGLGGFVAASLEEVKRD